MTFEKRFEVMEAVNLQLTINKQIDSVGACEPALADRLDDLINTFTPEQEDLFVSKMMKK